MINHKCTWLVAIGLNDQHEWIQSFLWYMTTQFKPTNFFFLSFLYAWVLVNQFLFFFFPTIFSPTYVCATQLGFESSLENTFSNLCLVLGMTLHILWHTIYSDTLQIVPFELTWSYHQCFRWLMRQMEQQQLMSGQTGKQKPDGDGLIVILDYG